jgi:hypothetical protein
MAWHVDSDAFQDGLKMDLSGCGAGWARIAVALRGTKPAEARECAGRAVTANPVAWQGWFDSFVAEKGHFEE